MIDRRDPSQATCMGGRQCDRNYELCCLLGAFVEETNELSDYQVVNRVCPNVLILEIKRDLFFQSKYQ